MYTRRSPVHDPLVKLRPTWTTIGRSPAVLHFGAPKDETKQAEILGLGDVSGLFKFGLKGHRADDWLRDKGLPIPETIYDWSPLPWPGGLIMRIKQDEFFLESGLEEGIAEAAREELRCGVHGCRLVERQEAGFVLTGSQIPDVMAQTCAVDMANAPGRLLMSRVAGISCMILPWNAGQAIRLWCGASYAVYLWETLLQIVRALGGMAVGLDTLRAYL